MKTIAIKTLASVVAFSALISAPALAQSARGSAGSRYDQHVTRDPDNVVIGGKVVGRDPDPFIRSQILRGYELSSPID
jgi:hypothetical protein